MNRLLLLISLSTWIYSTNSQVRFSCYENYCTTPGNECPNFSCEDGRTVENATKCGCCPLCITTLREGDECRKTYLRWEIGISECGHGLICKALKGINGNCTPSVCLQKIRDYEKEYSSDEKPLLKVTFECDYFGKFEPTDDDSSKPHIVCINDVLCFCVDKEGKRIFGTDFAKHNASVSDMNCDCSRDVINFPKTVDFEKLPRCLPNGNYDPLQCVQQKCFCMESAHSTYNQLVDADKMMNLFCYKDNRRPEQNRKTKCLKQREEELKRFSNKNLTVIGFDYTQCELDGTYYPLQCKKGRCYCVKRNGEKHIGFEDIEKDDGDLMCRCMRDKEIIQSYEGEKTNSMKTFENINCNGVYTSDNTVLPKLFVNDFIKH